MYVCICLAVSPYVLWMFGLLLDYSRYLPADVYIHANLFGESDVHSTQVHVILGFSLFIYIYVQIYTCVFFYRQCRRMFKEAFLLFICVLLVDINVNDDVAR